MDSCAQLLVAAEDGDADTVRAELLAGADLDVRPDGETPLLLACRHEHRSVVELLCDAGADAAIADDDGWTPLHWAAALASPRLVELLLGAGSPVAAQANCGSTALLFATEVDDCESVRLLLQSGARPTQASWPARCTRGSSPLALALAGLPSQEHIEVGRLLAEAAGLAGAWAQKEAVLNDQVRDAARRRRESSFIGNALDDDVGRCVVSMLPLASLGAIAQSDKRWQSWAAPRLAQERIAAAARALVLRHLDGRSMASVAVADGRWARELARFLTTKHTDSFDPWDEIWDHSSPETLGLVLKSIALRMQAADLVEFFRACVDVQEVELYSAQANVGKAVLSVRDRKLGWTPELLVELMDVCNGFEPGSWWSLDSMPARATTPDSRHFFSPATCPVRLSSHPFSDAYYSALSARELFPSDLQKAGYLGLLRHSNAADVTPESNAFFLLSLHGDLLNTPGVTFSTDAARAAGALAAEAGLNAATVIATVQKIHDVVEEFHFEMSEANQPRPFCWARELLKGFCLWGSNGTHPWFASKPPPFAAWSEGDQLALRQNFLVWATAWLDLSLPEPPDAYGLSSLTWQLEFHGPLLDPMVCSIAELAVCLRSDVFVVQSLALDVGQHEYNWRNHFSLEQLAGVQSPYPEGSEPAHFTIQFLEHWAAAAKFPHAWSVEDAAAFAATTLPLALPSPLQSVATVAAGSPLSSRASFWCSLRRALVRIGTRKPDVK